MEIRASKVFKYAIIAKFLSSFAGTRSETAEFYSAHLFVQTMCNQREDESALFSFRSGPICLGSP